MIRSLILAVTVGAGGLLAGCGFDWPTPGEIAVTSEPSGAAISLDGRATGLATPAVLRELDGGLYRVTVAQEGVVYRPAAKDVDVAYGQRANLHFETGTGSIAVTSNPPGAAIVLDGVLTDRVTPHTFTDIDPGEHTVTTQLAHHRNQTGELTVTVTRNTEATADFTLVIATVVLFEGFSNVSCTGCPLMLNNIAWLMDAGGYGCDRLVYVKYAGSNPNGADPMFLSNMTMVRNRSSYYTGMQTFALPTLVIQGGLAGSLGTPPGADGMQQAVAAGSLAPVDFYLTVTAPLAGDLELRDVDCEITVHAPHADIDLSEYLLRAVLVYAEVHTAQEYNPGGSEYHWVARRDAEVTNSLGTLAAAEPLVLTTTLNDPDPTLFNLTPFGREVIVFVQHNTTKNVIQAGSTMATSAAQTSARRF